MIMEEKLNSINKILKEKSEFKMVLSLKDFFENHLENNTINNQEIKVIIAHVEGSLAKVKERHAFSILLGFSLALLSAFILNVSSNSSASSVIADIIVGIILLVVVFTALLILFFAERTAVYKGTVLKKIAESYLNLGGSYETNPHHKRTIQSFRRDRRLR
ncbi:hypothetical protein [Halalkalibacter oceani]|uniref:hypothetical protein n=1 Tax=Halalkalibacter oceani TaxID=1653776 RepID=UPI003391157E